MLIFDEKIEENKLILNLPNEFIGKELEVHIFSKKDKNKNKFKNLRLLKTKEYKFNRDLANER